MPELFGLCVKAETKNKVKSIEISLEQTAADELTPPTIEIVGGVKVCVNLSGTAI